MEEWKDIEWFKGVNWKGLYQCNENGMVRSLDRYVERTSRYGNKYKALIKGVILTPIEDVDGYLFVNLQKGCGKDKISKGARLNRLTAITYNLEIPEHLKDIPIEQLEVDHINTDRKDNRLCNLCWADRKGNGNNPLTRQHISEVQKGRVFSEEHKRKLSEAHKKSI